MSYLKKCLKCGEFMIPRTVSTKYILWVCICGNQVEERFEDI